jgi:hypothetical protein
MKKFALLFTICLLFILSSPKIGFAQTRCNTWLYIGGGRSGVDIDRIHISGTSMTVECLFNRTTPYEPITQGGGELVSSHCSPVNVNYLLRPNSAQITTTNGFFQATDYASIALNTTYHAAMVYNGSTLTLYRNGIIVAQTAATGNLITNSYTTKIGRTACDESAVPTDFVGYINEVRIWNVARTQSQIQSYKNTLIPNPTLQSGLLAYYTFSGLYNKVFSLYYQGVFFGTMASINNTNPNTSFSICDKENGPLPLPPAPPQTTSDSYLKVSAPNSGVSIGDLDMTGNQLTIEAYINRTTSYNQTYGGGDVVSKHCTPSDMSYFLRPNQVGIKTTNGNFILDVGKTCPIETNKNYHIALVYDGTTLSLYRNRVIIDSKPASGSIILNNWVTSIGHTACTPNSNPSEFIGYINEVRIWNTVRSKAQLDQYEAFQIPDPTTQSNLIAYYIFNSLENKHNNATYPAIIVNNAAIKQTNPGTIYGTDCVCALCRKIETNGRLSTLSVSTYSNNSLIVPNPAHDYILFYSGQENSTYKIFNSMGNKVKEFLAKKGTNTIYIGSLPSGTYIIKQNDLDKLLLRFSKL